MAVINMMPVGRVEEIPPTYFPAVFAMNENGNREYLSLTNLTGNTLAFDSYNLHGNESECYIKMIPTKSFDAAFYNKSSVHFEKGKTYYLKTYSNVYRVYEDDCETILTETQTSTYAQRVLTLSKIYDD